MSLNETIFGLILSGYSVRFKKLSSFIIEVVVSNGWFFACNNIDATIDISDEDLCILLEYMKEEVDRQSFEHKKEKHYGLY